MPKQTDIYWNPLLETLPGEKLRALQVKKIQTDRGMGVRQRAVLPPTRAGGYQGFRGYSQDPQNRKGDDEGGPAKRALPLRGHAGCSRGSRDGLQADQRNHRGAGLPGLHLAGLGVVGRVLVLFPVRPGIQGQRPGVHPVRVQLSSSRSGRATTARRNWGAR